MSGTFLSVMTDFGDKLRRERERRGVPLRQIAERTKISVFALERLERNDLRRLPGGIFARAIVRSYASEVGLDPDATVREFVTRFGLEEPPDPGVAARAAGRPAPATVVKIVLGTLLAAAILLLLMLAGTSGAGPAPAHRQDDPGRRASSGPDPHPAGIRPRSFTL
jgi:cytoskeletal protein RodZ